MSSALNMEFFDAMEEIAGEDSALMLFLFGRCRKGYRFQSENNSI